MKLEIASDFAKCIEPLTDDEFRQLEENILDEGMVINPIIVWNGVIVDGHNRYRIVERHPHIKFTTHEKQFANRDEALAWICKNQLGRRNLTEEQRKYLIGKQYAFEKAAHGGERGLLHKENGQFTSSAQIGHLRLSNSASERIAAENGVSKNTVRRAEHYAKAVDVADEVEPGIKAEILKGTIKATAKDVEAIENAAPEEIPAILAELRKPRSEKPKTPKKEQLRETQISPIQQISQDLLTAHGKGTEDDLYFEFEDALDSLIFRWSLGIENNADFFANALFQLRINQLAHKGIIFLQQSIKGEKDE